MIEEKRAFHLKRMIEIQMRIFDTILDEIESNYSEYSTMSPDTALFLLSRFKSLDECTAHIKDYSEAIENLS